MKTNKLGITEGEYIAFTAGILSSVKVNDKQIAVFQGKNNDENSILFADAGTTANKCGNLPSELLEERNELLSVMKSLVSEVVSLIQEEDIDWQQAGYLQEASDLINKIEE